MEIILDIDGCIRDQIGGIIDTYNFEFFGEDTDRYIGRDHITKYNLNQVFPEIQLYKNMSAQDWFFKEHNCSTNLYAEVIGDSVENLKKLRERGVKINIVSYQPISQNQVYTIKWLNHNEIPYDSVTFSMKHDKSMVDGFVHIDDNPSFFSNSKASMFYLIDALYNRDMQQFDGVFQNLDGNWCANNYYGDCTEIHRFENIDKCLKYILETHRLYL